MLLHAAWERFAPLVEEVGFVLVGRQRRYALRFGPIGAASCADRLVLGQAAHQEDGRDPFPPKKHLKKRESEKPKTVQSPSEKPRGKKPNMQKAKRKATSTGQKRR